MPALVRVHIRNMKQCPTAEALKSILTTASQAAGMTSPGAGYGLIPSLARKP
jgi:hypothetical protein